jgi:hypothetical protein
MAAPALEIAEVERAATGWNEDLDANGDQEIDPVGQAETTYIVQTQKAEQ